MADQVMEINKAPPLMKVYACDGALMTHFGLSQSNQGFS